MPEPSLRARVALLMALGILLTLGLYSGLGWRSVRQLLTDDLNRDMRQFMAEARREVAQSPDLSTLTLDFPDYEVHSRALGPQGQVYVFSPPGAGQPGKALPAQFAGWRFSGTIQEEGGWRTLETPVSWRGQTLRLQAALRSPALERGIAAHRNRMALAALALIGLGAVIAYLLSWRALQPLEQLTRVSSRVAASGDLHTEVAVPRGEGAELSALAVSFNQMLARLREFRAREAAFHRQASHELRSPLAAMRLTLDAARAGYAETGETLDALDTELRRAQRLTASLLILAREGRLAQTQRVDLAALARDRAQRAGAAYQGLTSAVVEGDATLLERALDNLLENAARYAPGAPVQVAVQPLSGQPLSGQPLSGQPVAGPPGEYVLSVQDWGLGLAEEELPHLTDEFYRAHRGEDSPGGTGLGLSVVRHIVSAHGGRAVIEPTLPHGLRVALHLPALHLPVPGPPGSPPAPAGRAD